METLIPFALLCFTSFFTLTNPLGTMPVFLTMTQGMTDKERCSIVKRATLVSFITLMGTAKSVAITRVPVFGAHIVALFQSLAQ